MRLYLRLAWRNVWRHSRRTLIVVIAMALALSMMMMYDGLIAGFDQAIYGNAIKVLGGNLQVHASGYSEKEDLTPLLPLPNDQAVVKAAMALPQVEAATRRINTGGLATNREGAFGVTITGIVPEEEQSINLAEQHIISGRNLTSSDQDAILIGKGLADAMDVKVGDRINVTGRAMHEQMRQRTMTVTGIYDLGLPDIEKRTIYTSLGEAQDLYGLGNQTTEVVINLKQIGDEGKVIAALTPVLNGYEFQPWQTDFPELESALATKGGVMNIFSVIILLIAAIGILNILMMAVYERTREIGLLAALGLKPRQIGALFLLEGGMMGLVGLVFGIGLGLLINVTLGRVGFDFSQFSSITEYTALISGRVYPTLGMNKLLGRGLTVLIISILAAFIPAREASQSEPAEALHYV
jgi:ABC-type lipoprotein release transport system permease subunit